MASEKGPAFGKVGIPETEPPMNKLETELRGLGDREMIKLLDALQDLRNGVEVAAKVLEQDRVRARFLAVKINGAVVRWTDGARALTSDETKSLEKLN